MRSVGIEEETSYLTWRSAGAAGATIPDIAGTGIEAGTAAVGGFFGSGGSVTPILRGDAESGGFAFEVLAGIGLSVVRFHSSLALRPDGTAVPGNTTVTVSADGWDGPFSWELVWADNPSVSTKDNKASVWRSWKVLMALSGTKSLGRAIKLRALGDC